LSQLLAAPSGIAAIDGGVRATALRPSESDFLSMLSALNWDQALVKKIEIGRDTGKQHINSSTSKKHLEEYFGM
jgi:hypothetical protein